MVLALGFRVRGYGLGFRVELSGVSFRFRRISTPFFSSRAAEYSTFINSKSVVEFNAGVVCTVPCRAGSGVGMKKG